MFFENKKSRKYQYFYYINDFKAFKILFLLNLNIIIMNVESSLLKIVLIRIKCYFLTNFWYVTSRNSIFLLRATFFFFKYSIFVNMPTDCSLNSSYFLFIKIKEVKTENLAC